MNRSRSFAWLLVLMLVAVACEQNADVQNPQSYSGENFEFQYPGNWKVTDDRQTDYGNYIIIESPGDAIFIIRAYSKSDAVALEDFVTSFSEQAQEATSVGTVESVRVIPIEKEIGGVPIDGIRERVIISLLGEEVPHRRTYFAIERTEQVVFLIAQTAEEHIPLVTDGFELIWRTFTMKRSA